MNYQADSVTGAEPELWVQCELCGKWRKVLFAPGADEPFKCSDNPPADCTTACDYCHAEKQCLCQDTNSAQDVDDQQQVPLVHELSHDLDYYEDDDRLNGETGNGQGFLSNTEASVSKKPRLLDAEKQSDLEDTPLAGAAESGAWAMDAGGVTSAAAAEALLRASSNTLKQDRKRFRKMQRKLAKMEQKRKDDLAEAVKLVMACSTGKESVVKAILSKNVDVKLSTKEVVQGLIANKADVHSTTQDLAEHLISNNISSKKSAIQQLTRCKANLKVFLRKFVTTDPLPETAPIRLVRSKVNLQVIHDLMDQLQSTPIFLAAQAGSANLVRDLIAAAADINKAQPRTSCTPLLVACRGGHTEVVSQILAKQGVNLKQADVHGWRPIHAAANTTSILKQLLAKRTRVNAKTGTGATPLLIACQSGMKSSVNALLRQRADPNIGDMNGVAPLWAATYRQHADIVRLLLEEGSRVNATACGGDTPLWIAVLTAPVGLFNSQRGSQKSKKGKSGPTSNDKNPVKSATQPDSALSNGKERDNIQVINLLLKAKAVVNRCSRTHTSGFGPLHIAVHRGHAVAVSALLRAGANVNKLTANPQRFTSALHLAVEGGNKALVFSLIAARADINIRDWNQQTPANLAGKNSELKSLLSS